MWHAGVGISDHGVQIDRGLEDHGQTALSHLQQHLLHLAPVLVVVGPAGGDVMERDGRRGDAAGGGEGRGAGAQDRCSVPL